MNNLEKELDKLVQIWATKQRSHISCQPAQVGHHYYSRRIKLLRWDLKNIIPLTHCEHTSVHNGQLKIVLSPEIKSYLDKMAIKDFKSHLLENNLSENEWIKNKQKEVKNCIDNIKY